MAAEQYKPIATKALIVSGVGAALFLILAFIYRFAQLLATFFCGVLIAVLLTALTRAVCKRLNWPYWAGFASSLVLLTSLGGLATWLVGAAFADQVGELAEAVPRGVAKVQDWLRERAWGQSLLELIGQPKDLAPTPRAMANRAASVLAMGSQVVTSLFVAIFVGLFLAAKPSVYRRGLLHLFPGSQRPRVEQVLDELGHGLRAWLVARLALMALIGVLMGTGLALLGVRLALPLGLLTALFSFVPYLGAVAAFVPAVLVALLEDPTLALHVGLLYLGIQLVESYIAEPLIEAHAVTIPPALLLLGQGVLAVSLGALGVLIATPLVVVVVTLVRMLWVESALGDTSVSDQDSERDANVNQSPPRPGPEPPRHDPSGYRRGASAASR